MNHGHRHDWVQCVLAFTHRPRHLQLLNAAWAAAVAGCIFCVCRKQVEEEPDPAQIAKDMERLALIKRKRWETETHAGHTCRSQAWQGAE